MFFSLKIGNRLLTGLIGKDAELYWDSCSLGSVMGYKAVYQFANKHFVKHVEDVTTDEQKKKCGKQYLRKKILDHSNLLVYLQNSKRPASAYTYGLLKDFDFFVMVVVEKRKYPLLKVCCAGTPEVIKFSVWLKAYKVQVQPQSLAPASIVLPPKKRVTLMVSPQCSPDSSLPLQPEDSPTNTQDSPSYSPTSPLYSPASPSYTPTSHSPQPTSVATVPRPTVTFREIMEQFIDPYSLPPHEGPIEFSLWMDTPESRKIATFFKYF